ncbi:MULTISPECIES: hypothetical protein [Bacillus cereus group]|uniref:Uncharacterized protein n=1 Tax=Bacillus thuringiensis serovar toumanoffi TaxID=180862 RepID=A0ABD5I968_BACTU|nr:hypothetical protein [Bacillus thuringiensis]MCU5282717.1 hypothetical protein [Bacillus cereus]MCR6783671.1 hypothetical protein [Bacillus thuringiensis]MCR6862016.1 hypothetical protein [Bacillus thuringiensis]MCR6869567.1 hypothetical protein [Bacillus thuringiensis]MCT6946992.1 hypothetical protein [Bacillus thuringiensis]
MDSKSTSFVLMLIWLLQIKVDFSFVQELGDASTIIGLGLVILFIGFELLTT